MCIAYAVRRAQALRRRREALEAADEQTRRAEVTPLSTPSQTRGRIALAAHIQIEDVREKLIGSFGIGIRVAHNFEFRIVAEL